MNPGPLDLRDYLAILWARKWIILAVVVTTTAAAAWYSYRQTPVYSSSSVVVVRPARFDPTQPASAFGFLSMETEQQVANSAAVAEIALKRLAGQGIELGTISAGLTENAQTISFNASAPTPASAQATADAYARAYLEHRHEELLSELDAVRAPYERRLEDISAQLRTITRALGQAQSDAQKALLNTRYGLLWSERGATMDRLGQFVTPENLQVGEVLRTAPFPLAPSSPDHERDVGIGFILGLALGIGVAFFRDRLDDRVRGRDELELHSGAPVLAFIPRFAGAKGTPVTLSRPRSDAAEAYRGLRVRLLHAATERNLKTIVVTSSLAGEGKTSTTANLAVALAVAGKRVVMVSADLRQPRLHSFFPVESVGGLRDVLAGSRRPIDVLSFTGTENLWLIDAGAASHGPSPLELLGSTSMRDVLLELRSFADFVLVDTPPLLTTSDVQALVPLSDGVLFVADPRRVTRPIVEQARRDLQLMDVVLIGIVVNRYDPRRFRAYGTGYGYYGYPDHAEGRPSTNGGRHTIVPAREGSIRP